ncbi:hypothetical protein SAY86_001659 [Trapa natans]|uniref:Uncharacterized protein n=1 Tax=Trapa natans TaxID=22666 RepID=A0AAN7R1R8_TRANT|nr:hypothetical protein SAY86_001659 [Trapa natans]
MSVSFEAAIEMEEGGAKGQRKKEGRNLLRRGIYNNSSEAVTRLWPPPHPLKEVLIHFFYEQRTCLFIES